MHWRKSATAILFDLAVVCSILASCGRSTQLTERPGSNSANSANATNIANSTNNTTCKPSCDQICRVVDSCLADWPCLDRCRGNLGEPMFRCLAQIACDDELSTSASCNRVKTCFDNPTLPDLQVRSFNTSLRDGRIDYSAEICNTGGTATPFEVHFYRNRSSAPRFGDRGDRVARSNRTLGAGKCREVSSQDENLPPGFYATWAQVDPLDKIAELDEANNVAGPREIFLDSALPDLVVVDFSTYDEDGDNDIIFEVILCNEGSAPASASSIGFFFDRPDPPSYQDWVEALVETEPLQPGQCTALDIAVGLSQGEHNAWALIDPLQLVAESNEQNNTAGPVEFYIVGMQSPDLVVTQLFIAGSTTGTTTIEAEVCNGGNGPAEPTSLSVYYDRASPPSLFSPPDATYDLPFLPSGACTKLGGPVFLSPGSYTAWAFVDSEDQVPESNEDNNVTGPIAYTIDGGADIDLTVINLSAQPTSSGNGAYYSATVCNYGTDDAKGVNIGLYHNRSSPPGPFSTPDKTIYLSFVASSGCVSVSEVSYLQPGTYNSWAFVDPYDNFIEASESNNIDGPVEVVVGGAQADLIIASFVAGGAVGGGFYGVQVCNDGGSASGPFNLGFFFNLPAAPNVGDLPDHTLSVAGLASGVCQHAGTFVALPSGSYNSWALVDIYNNVTEGDESNNVAGPQSFSVGGSETPCQTICDALVSPCNLLPSSEQPSCVTSCEAQQPEVIACALEATAQLLCDEILQCLFGN